MILYYAQGGGLGHLTRARAVLNALAAGEETAIMTASSFGRDRRVTGGTGVIAVPFEMASAPPLYRAWLTEVFSRTRPSAVFIDTFPAGIIGEFCDFSFPDNTGIYHIARLLRWPEYAKLLAGKPPTFRHTWMLEPLAASHAEFLHTHSNKISPLTLGEPDRSVSRKAGKIIEELRSEGRPVWLVVHSGPEEEIAELIAYGEEMSRIEGGNPKIVLISPERPEELRSGIAHLDFYPASIFFPSADRIITGCGFNAMRETEAFKEKHRFIPFARRFDDQFLRAARRKSTMREE